MTIILMVLGALQIIGGVFVALAAKSAIHEILGAISFGMGVIALGLSAVVARLEDVNASVQRQH